MIPNCKDTPTIAKAEEDDDDNDDEFPLRWNEHSICLG
jgi:hypothetical protein